ncbi:MAG TPA: hypothetical protein VMT76_14430 [Puia sp.]|nr:hypothetical protein [Puia sp.]
MNCTDSKNEMLNMLDGCVDHFTKNNFEEHLKSCKDCSTEYNEMKDVAELLSPKTEIKAPLSLKKNVLEKLNSSEAVYNSGRGRVIPMSKLVKKILAVAAIITGILFIIPFLGRKGSGSNTAKAASVFLMNAIDATDSIKNMAIDFHVRTTVNDNFNSIDKSDAMVEHHLIETFDKPEKWRIEKSGRIVVSDGFNQYLWIPGLQLAYKTPVNADLVDWMNILLDPATIFWKEKQEAEEKGSVIIMKNENGNTLISITSKAQGNFLNDYMKGKTLPGSDNRREYIFDSKTKLIKGLKIFILENKKETLVFEIDDVRYNTAINNNIFSISLPKDVHWQTSFGDLSKGLANKADAKEIAALALNDLSKADFTAHKELWAQFNFMTKKILSQNYAGSKIIKIGEPFRSGSYAGIFVPYEIKLPTGYLKKFVLALRNDNLYKIWLVDGGI